MSNPPTTPGPVYQSIQSKLSELLQPTTLEIQNDSWQHRHHSAMRETGGGNGETHFTVRIVSTAFTGKSTMQRHRMIYGALSEEFAQGLHALSLQTKTPDEVAKAGAEES
ncbi:hypothetical protein FS749_016067 [Ceratobasidium sp. UAMH 11750]|nr:hypothetical protein FS749_016067 [Ceratobasidium sp. UAMH 11750]